MTSASCCTGALTLRYYNLRLTAISLLLLASLIFISQATDLSSEVAPAQQQQQLQSQASPYYGFGQKLSDSLRSATNQLTTCTNNCKLENDNDNRGSSQRIGFKVMRAIFDYSAYKQLFHKSYSSLVGELARRKYFLSRAFRAFVSAIKYKHRQLTYFLAINHMSDLSPQELAQMDNEALEEADPFEALNKHLEMTEITAKPLPLPQLENLPTVDKVEAEIRGFFQASIVGDLLDMSKELLSKVAPLVGLNRKKREVAPTRKQEAPKKVLLEEGGEALVSGPFSEMSFIIQNKNGPSKRTEAPTPPVRSSSSSGRGVIQADNQEDEVFIDHRKSGCMFEPRGQGKCGSCYSFSIIAYMEWLYCFKTRKLLAFSEQYLVDCGKGRVGNLNGCSGGGRFSIGDFVMNFGLELRSSYPYRMREDHCPYSQETRLQETGTFRWTGLESGSSIPMDLWHIHLKNGPMIVSLSTTNTGFKEYGGGVYDGAQCNPSKANHMMLLVGHGREDNQEYWLIRNSYTVGWGEQGYYRLSKKANCVYLAKGFMYGTNDGGRTFAAEPSRNKLNRDKHIKNHYAQNMANDLKFWKL